LAISPKAKLAIKSVLTALVLAFVARHVAGTWRDLAARGAYLRIDWPWMALASAFYLAGLAAFGAYFGRVLASGPKPTRAYPSLRAYFISHLGKYVPGKALVVVMRAGLLTPHGARASTAAFATLYETLVMMATGALASSLVFAIGWYTPPPAARGHATDIARIDIRLAAILAGAGLGLAFLVAAWPSVFPRLARLARVPFPDVGPEALPRVSAGLLAEGVAWSLVGWALLGLSQVAVIRGLRPGGLTPSAWPLAMACVALATVAGFAVPISPGGLGVREWVLWTALGSAIDRDLAVVSALALRLAWVVGELVTAAVLVSIRPSAPQPPRSP